MFWYSPTSVSGEKTLASQQKRTDTVCPSQQAMTQFLTKSFSCWSHKPFSAVV